MTLEKRLDPDTKTFLIQRASTDDHQYVRLAAVEELARGFKDDRPSGSQKSKVKSQKYKKGTSP